MAPGTRSRQVEPRVRRSRQSRKSYREDSTESEGDCSDNGSEEYEAPSSPRRHRRTLRSGPSPRSSKSTLGKPKATETRLLTSRNNRVRTIGSKSKDETVESSNRTMMSSRIPPWHTLPYHILYQVFLYATRPLFTEVFVPTSSTRWLLRTALICKSFAEPALSVLYFSPPLTPPSRTRGLLEHLQAQDDHSTFNYRSKVKYLDFEASDTLFRKYRGEDPIDVRELLAITPQLRGISFHLRTDFIRGHRFAFTMPRLKAAQVLQSTTDALTKQGLQLQEWKWNIATTAFLGVDGYFGMKECHETLPFQRITKLTISRLFPGVSDSRIPEGVLAAAIGALPALQELRLSASAIANATLLPLLPQGLQRIGITECSIDAKTLAEFLASHGRSIRHLSLDHNKALNLSFLIDFAKSCPALETLAMDLTYYDSHSTFSDSDPQFDALLQPHEVPTWPATLQKIELLHLRKWDNDVAEVFFRSLIDAAELLPNLRYLHIKASLNESGWRERVSFRDRWAATLRKVFLRVCPPPNPNLRSIAAFKAYKSEQVDAADARMSVQACTSKDEPGKVRRRGRPRILPDAGRKRKAEVMVEPEESGSSDEPLVRKRRSTRLQHLGEASYTSSSTHRRRRRRDAKHRDGDGSDDESSSEEDSAIDDDTSLTSQDQTMQQQAKGSDELYIQGMCDVVRILIDNLRPTEEQLAESDFLDEEVSGDEDWNGDDDGFGNDGYAW